jgi:hypothetical protein
MAWHEQLLAIKLVAHNFRESLELCVFDQSCFFVSVAVFVRLLVDEGTAVIEGELFREVIVIHARLNFAMVFDVYRVELLCVKVLNHNFRNAVAFAVDCYEVMKAVELLNHEVGVFERKQVFPLGVGGLKSSNFKAFLFGSEGCYRNKHVP